MRDTLFSLLIGILIGAVGYEAYYDGVVSNDYKLRLQRATQGLERADQQIKIRDSDINYLLNYLEAQRTKIKELEKLLAKKTA
jgi:5-bromo-4-chloroindolyl phosphate hydrolysis protein